MLAGQISLEDDDTIAAHAARPPSAAELVQVWTTVQATEREISWGNLELPGIKAQVMPDFLDPRWLIRMLSVYRMKKRAGVVGGNGVSPLLGEIRNSTKARLHLIGHSYGAKLLLSAVAGLPKPAHDERPIHSLLLLQGAISSLSFADQVPETDQPGRYRAVLDRVFQPVLTTYSIHDFPLHRIYHLIFRRHGDMGDVAAFADTASQYAALGGSGPIPPQHIKIPLPRYPGKIPPVDDKVRLYGFDASDVIAGHGDINNYATWWLLYQQLGQVEK
ncbi:hypothetical protein XB05_10960 [Xanthomonas arboricola]|nr:hypothetical protein XB05_10960 [Xanthomonas arboricola]